jgi:hypothetical protein
MDEVKAIVLVEDTVLASSLELALLAVGIVPILHDPALGLEDLPLHGATTLIVGPCVLPPRPMAFVKALRARPWDGLVILITGEAQELRANFEGAHRVAVLEMPFVGADLIAVIRGASAAGEPPSNP